MVQSGKSSNSYGTWSIFRRSDPAIRSLKLANFKWLKASHHQRLWFAVVISPPFRWFSWPNHEPKWRWHLAKTTKLGWENAIFGAILNGGEFGLVLSSFPHFTEKKGGESILVHVFLIFFNHKGSPWDHQNHQNHQSTVRNVSGTRIGSLENDPGTGIGPPALPSHRRRGAEDLAVGADRQRPSQWPSQWPFGGEPGRFRPGEWAGFRSLQGSKLNDFLSKDKEHHGASAFFGGPKIQKKHPQCIFCW